MKPLFFLTVRGGKPNTWSTYRGKIWEGLNLFQGQKLEVYYQSASAGSIYYKYISSIRRGSHK